MEATFTHMMPAEAGWRCFRCSIDKNDDAVFERIPVVGWGLNSNGTIEMLVLIKRTGVRGVSSIKNYQIVESEAELDREALEAEARGKEQKRKKSTEPEELM